MYNSAYLLLLEKLCYCLQLLIGLSLLSLSTLRYYRSYYYCAREQNLGMSTAACSMKLALLLFLFEDAALGMGIDFLGEFSDVAANPIF